MRYGASSNNMIINSFFCKGNFLFDEDEINDVYFDLVQYSDAKIDIFVDSNDLITVYKFMDAHINKKKSYCKIKAKLSDYSANVYINNALVSKLNLEFKNNNIIFRLILKVNSPLEIIYDEINSEYCEVCVGLTNFLHDLNKNDFLDFSINLDEFYASFTGVEGYEYYKQLLLFNNDLSFVTSEMLIKTNENNARKFIDALTDLLSYSNRTRIGSIYEFYKFENKIYKIILRPIITSKFTNAKKLIEVKNLPYFLESSFNEFISNFNNFSLYIILGFYLESIKSQFVDIGYISAVVTLETILSAYEEYCLNNGNIIISTSFNYKEKKIKNFLERKCYSFEDSDIEELSKEISYSKPSVMDKLNCMNKDDDFYLDLNRYDYDFPQIRNSLVHSGKFPNIIKSSGKERELDKVKEFNRIIFLLDKILLSILKYDGDFYNILDKKYSKLSMDY